MSTPMQRCLLTHFPIAFLRLSAALQAVSGSFLLPRGLIIPQLPLEYCPFIVLFETWSDKNRKFNRNHFYSVSLSLSLSYTASASLLFVSWLACFAIPMAVMALSQLNRWSSLGHHTHWIIWYVATRNDCVSHFTHVAYVLQPQWSLWIHTSTRQVNWDKCASLVWSHLLRLLLWLVCLCDALYNICVFDCALFWKSNLLLHICDISGGVAWIVSLSLSFFLFLDRTPLAQRWRSKNAQKSAQTL